MKRFFSDEEYEQRIERLRHLMGERGIDAGLISSPENIYYLTGLDHQGYFAYQLLVIPLEAPPIFVSRAMEKATVRDQMPKVRHVGYSDGIEPMPPPIDRQEDIVFATRDEGGTVRGLRPWEMSAGVSVRGPLSEKSVVQVETTLEVLRELGLEKACIGIEKSSSFLPFQVAEGIIDGMRGAEWINISGMVEDCRIIQSPRELECTRAAAEISDAMMLSAIAAAGSGVYTRDVVASLYDAMFRRGGTYPGFVPLVRTTRTLEHEHGTWQDGRLRNKDILFLEMAGCVRRYHAPLGRLVFIGKAPGPAFDMQRVCLEAMERAGETIGPGVAAGEVYRAWQERLDSAGLNAYRRHHCGYAVGIGFPPSWSGSGTPQGLRSDSKLEIRPGMVFHLMSWLLRTGRGDSFLSDTIVVTDKGCEFLTKTGRDVTVR
ncbi:MAG: M24 family metallopeptidase [Woeseiaceae bacterium]